MSGQFLRLTNDLMGVALLALRFLKQCRLGTYPCFIIFLIVTGCSSLHIDISPAVDWSRVRVVEFQSPLQDSWELTQPIKSELITMGFQITEKTNTSPDLIFSYFTQEKPDLTAESKVVTRLKSLHVQFIDPAKKTLVTAVDYFYPEGTNPSAPVSGVKEVFSGLRQQINKEINAQSQVPEMVRTQPLPAALVVVPPKYIQGSQTEQLKTESLSIEIKPEENVANNNQSAFVETVVPRSEAITDLTKSDKKDRQPVQQTRSPWLPKLRSWGFDTWGQDSVSDY